MPDPLDDGEVRIVLRPLADDVAWPHRVRALLKYALRYCRLRCVRIEGLPHATPDATDGTKEDDAP